MASAVKHIHWQKSFTEDSVRIGISPELFQNLFSHLRFQITTSCILLKIKRIYCNKQVKKHNIYKMYKIVRKVLGFWLKMPYIFYIKKEGLESCKKFICY